MILDPKKTTVAYRCPSCGSGVMSIVGLFDFGADMMKLKCDCGASAMTVLYGKDSKVRMTVPCFLCPNPHTFTVSTSVFFKDDLFLLPCPYSDISIAMTGNTNKVKAELARSELELLELIEKSGVENLDSLHRNEDFYANPEIVEIITYTIRELDSEGNIKCGCPEGVEGDYTLDFLKDEIHVECKGCGCKKILRADSLMAAHDLLNLDELTLEPNT